MVRDRWIEHARFLRQDTNWQMRIGGDENRADLLSGGNVTLRGADAFRTLSEMNCALRQATCRGCERIEALERSDRLDRDRQQTWRR